MFWTIVGALLFIFIGIPFILGLIGYTFVGLGKVFLLIVEKVFYSKGKVVNSKTGHLADEKAVENLISEEEDEMEVVFIPKHDGKKHE